MRYLLTIVADGMPEPEKLAVLQRECPRWVHEMDGRGVRLLGRELDPPEATTTVRVRHGETLVTDGPFAETKEFMAGLDIIECANLDDAIEVAASHPVSWYTAIEVRPFAGDLHLGEAAAAFARGDACGEPFLLVTWMGGTPATPVHDQAVADEGDGWRRDLDRRGLHVLGDALGRPDTATTVRVRDGSTLLADGPFVQGEDFIASIDVVRCQDRQEAVELAASHPVARHHAIEVRPFCNE